MLDEEMNGIEEIKEENENGYSQSLEYGVKVQKSLSCKPVNGRFSINGVEKLQGIDFSKSNIYSPDDPSSLKPSMLKSPQTEQKVWSLTFQSTPSKQTAYTDSKEDGGHATTGRWTKG